MIQDNSEITYSHKWIYELENKLHWKLYWHQLNLVMNVSDISSNEQIIEIGVGSGLVSNYLKRNGFNITTIDIDENKKPDIVANVVEDEIPTADVYLAFEIFEHIPYEALKKVFMKMSQKRVGQVLFSVPHAYRTYFFGEFWMPYFGSKTIHIGRKRNHINTENHHWELGINGITQKKIEATIKEYGYEIDYNFRYRNHQFCIAKLKKE